MGYRSEVIFGAKSEHKNKINAILKEHELEETFSLHETEDWVMYKGEHLRWYSEFKDVSEINSAINKIIDDSQTDYFSEAFMVCLGEDNKIHNERGNWYDFVYQESSIQLFQEQTKAL